MAHAIGVLGTSQNLSTKTKPRMTREQRAKNNSLVPRRNQTRAIGFIKISREGEAPRVRAIRAGHAHHYQAAYIYASVEIVKDEQGRPLTLKRK